MSVATVRQVYPTETFPLEVRAKGNAFGVVGWSVGNGCARPAATAHTHTTLTCSHDDRWLTLLNPVMFSRIGENTLHIFGAINFLSIPMVWALYPETANRTLEEMDLLFASKSPWVWDEEAHFRKLKLERPELEHVAGGVLPRDDESPVQLDEKDEVQVEKNDL